MDLKHKSMFIQLLGLGFFVGVSLNPCSIVGCAEDSTGPYTFDTSLLESSAAFYGLNSSDQVCTVASAGDVNGDGYDDFLISTSTYRTSAPAIFYLFFGGSAQLSGTMPASSANVVIQDPELAISDSVQGVGDVNGDGIDDFILAGLWLFFGKTSDWNESMDITEADVQMNLGSEKLGISFAARAGDVNGDGVDDFLVTTVDGLNIGDVDGHCFLVLGRTTGWSTSYNLLTEAIVSFDDGLKKSLTAAGAGDLNGDGLSDILVGSPFNESGKVYLFWGRAEGWSRVMDMDSADIQFVSETYSGWLGYSLKSVGDVNGDGYDDILIGDPYYSVTGAIHGRHGKVYLIFGKTGDWNQLYNIQDSDASFAGVNERDLAGNCLGSAGDLDRDGYMDFLIGAPSLISSGKVYLIFGKPSGWKNNTSLAESDASFVGEYEGNMAGDGLAGGGDFNRSGYPDFLIGARSYDRAAGKVYLFYGETPFESFKGPGVWVLNGYGGVTKLSAEE